MLAILSKSKTTIDSEAVRTAIPFLRAYKAKGVDEVDQVLLFLMKMI
jgi:hypothetical protein